MSDDEEFIEMSDQGTDENGMITWIPDSLVLADSFVLDPPNTTSNKETFLYEFAEASKFLENFEEM